MRAEISINGVFKGECPLDIQVKPGTIQLRALKKIDASRERVFADEFRMGEGVVKKVEVILSAPRLNAAGQKLEEERLRVEAVKLALRADDENWQTAESAQDSASIQGYISRYPVGRHAAAAQQKLTAIHQAEVELAPVKYTRGLVGMEMANATNPAGILIKRVVKDGPADKAGLQVNDVILMFNGKIVTEQANLSRIIRATPPGSKVGVQLLRRGGNTVVKLVVEELTDDMLISIKTRTEIQETRSLFPEATANKVVTLKMVGNVYPGSEPYDLTIFNKNGLCNWELSTGVTGFYFGAGILPAGGIGSLLAADEVTLRNKQTFTGSIATMSAGQSLIVSSQQGETKVTVMETKPSWPELNFPYAGTRLLISKNYEPSFYYDRDQIAVYSPEIGCAVPISQDVLKNTGNRLFGDKQKFTEKALSAVFTEK